MPGMVDCEMMIDAAATIIVLDVLKDSPGILNTV
jgi:hypothetical protein